MSERSDDDIARQQRLDALRKLAGEPPSPASEAPQPTTAPHPALSGAGLNQGSDTEAGAATARVRRWRMAALIGLVALMIIAGAVGFTLRRNGAALGPLSAKPAPPALTVKTFSVGNAAGVYCASAPAWSPDGKSLAVFGQTNTPTDTCLPYDNQTVITALGIAVTVSANHADGYALVILDSATGHISGRVALPIPDQSALCDASPSCVIQNLSPQSLAWSPDGHSIATFFTCERLLGAAGPTQSVQECGGLLIAQVGASATPSAAPRLLLAAAAPQTIGAASLAGLPLFIWNLGSGTATTSAIPGALTGATPPFTPSYQWAPNGQFIQTPGDTIPFAAAYEWSPDDRIVSVAAPAEQSRGVAVAWSSGVVSQRRSATDPVLFRTRQWLWSPDGQFVASNLGASAYITAPGAIQPTVYGPYTPPLVNAPYVALDVAVKASLGSQAGVELAQSPDGKLLASYSCGTDGTIGQLTLRPVKSGGALAQASYMYPSSVFSLGCYGDIGDLDWSPDGAHLASADEQTSQIIVWQVNIHT
jgi:hypothetical protein